MKGENSFEKEEVIAIHNCNNDGSIYFVQYYNSGCRATC